MKLVIEINCDNAAFADDDSPQVGQECARILARLARLLADDSSPRGGWSQTLTDYNGNVVGSATFQD